MPDFGGAFKRTIAGFVLSVCMVTWVYAGSADIKPTPLLNLQAGISDELIVSIRKGDTAINDLITVFSEEEQKNLPVRIDQRLTPLCAAASGRNVKAIKELIALGANVNSMCINMGLITNPLEMAYRVMSLQETENEASKLLKENGAVISDDWVESYILQKQLTQYMDEEAKKNAIENLKTLGKIYLQMAQNIVSQRILYDGVMSAAKLSKELISTTLDVAHENEAQQEIMVVELDPRISAFIKKTPFTHATRKYFADLASGKAWCSSYQSTEQLIVIINSMNATLIKMNRCSCDQTGMTGVALPYVCGIPYAYKTKIEGGGSAHKPAQLLPNTVRVN